MKRIGKLQEIVAHGQATEMEGYLMDTTTASMLLSIYNALKPENQDRFDTIPLPSLVSFGWENVK